MSQELDSTVRAVKGSPVLRYTARQFTKGLIRHYVKNEVCARTLLDLEDWATLEQPLRELKIGEIVAMECESRLG